MVCGSTKTLLRNVSGNRITKPTLITAFGVRRTRPSAVQTQESDEREDDHEGDGGEHARRTPPPAW